MFIDGGFWCHNTYFLHFELFRIFGSELKFSKSSHHDVIIIVDYAISDLIAVFLNVQLNLLVDDSVIELIRDALHKLTDNSLL